MNTYSVRIDSSGNGYTATGIHFTAYFTGGGKCNARINGMDYIDIQVDLKVTIPDHTIRVSDIDEGNNWITFEITPTRSLPFSPPIELTIYSMTSEAATPDLNLYFVSISESAPVGMLAINGAEFPVWAGDCIDTHKHRIEIVTIHIDDAFNFGDLKIYQF